MYLVFNDTYETNKESAQVIVNDELSIKINEIIYKGKKISVNTKKIGQNLIEGETETLILQHQRIKFFKPLISYFVYSNGTNIKKYIKISSKNNSSIKKSRFESLLDLGVDAEFEY